MQSARGPAHQIAKAFVHCSRTLEIREQQCHLSDPETFGLVDTFRSEKPTESLPGESIPDMYGSNSSAGLIVWARTSGGQLIRSRRSAWHVSATTRRSISCVSRPIAPGHNTGVPIKQRYESMRVSNAHRVVEAARKIERVIAG
jgi:hypothetical protein